MEFDWTVARVDFMEKFSAEVKEKGSLETVLENYEKENRFPCCGNCCFYEFCACGCSSICYDTIQTAYKKYCQTFNKTTTEKTKEKILLFIELDGGIEETLRLTADQYKVIKYLAECNYFDEAVRLYTEETLEYNLTDFT